MYIKALCDPEDIGDLGQKCANIARLVAFGINVPPAFGVTFSAFEEFIMPMLPQIRSLVRTQNVANASLAIRESILHRAIPLAVENALAAALISFPADTKFAVRSSGIATSAGIAVVEDSDNLSLAGQFESFLHVDRTQVRHALKRCWAAMYNERTLRLFKAQSDDSFFSSRMSVVIQTMIQADLAAVVMTRDPVQQADVLAMEVTYGPCEALVSGKVTGDLVTLDRKTLQVSSREIGSKRQRVVYEPYTEENQGTYRLVPIDDELRNRPAVDDTLAVRIAKLGLEIEARFGRPQDIELVLSRRAVGFHGTRKPSGIRDFSLRNAHVSIA